MKNKIFAERNAGRTCLHLQRMNNVEINDISAADRIDRNGVDVTAEHTT